MEKGEIEEALRQQEERSSPMPPPRDDPQCHSALEHKSVTQSPLPGPLDRPPPNDTGGHNTLPTERFLFSVAEQAGRNLKILRVHTDLGSKKLSKLSGVGHSILRVIEAGSRPLQVHQAIRIAMVTGVDVCSLMTSNVLYEWGGGNPYTSESYEEWVKRGQSPSVEQIDAGKKHLEDQCTQLATGLKVDPVIEAYLSAHVNVLLHELKPKAPKE